jgi:hypothetical protein
MLSKIVTKIYTRIKEGYVRIYKEELEKCTKVKPFATPYLRPETNGPYGIYAHGWETLSIERICKYGRCFYSCNGIINN